MTSIRAARDAGFLRARGRTARTGNGLAARAADRQARERGARLDEAVARCEAVLRLELQIAGSPLWAQVAEVRLLRRAEIDQAALRFSPFRDGKGLTPRGFVHGLRRATYLLSQLARPASAR